MEVSDQLPERRVRTRGGLWGMSPARLEGLWGYYGFERIKPNLLFFFLCITPADPWWAPPQQRAVGVRRKRGEIKTEWETCAALQLITGFLSLAASESSAIKPWRFLMLIVGTRCPSCGQTGLMPCPFLMSLLQRKHILALHKLRSIPQGQFTSHILSFIFHLDVLSAAANIIILTLTNLNNFIFLCLWLGISVWTDIR